jgi:CRISPR-associated protein Cas2
MTMVMAVLERVPVGLRGELTRWLLEVRAGVFVGTCSAMVRERLWRHIERDLGDEGGAVLVHTADNEQGFVLNVLGDPSYHVEDFDGLQLIRRV